MGQKWAAGLNDIKDLYEKGYFPVNTLTATDAETVQLFGDGEAAFLIGLALGGYRVLDRADDAGDVGVGIGRRLLARPMPRPCSSLATARPPSSSTAPGR